MKRVIVCAILGMAFSCLSPALSRAVLGDWEVRVVDRERPVPDAIVTIATHDGPILDTKTTDSAGTVRTRLDRGRSYGVTVKTPSGQSRFFHVMIGPSQQSATVDVARSQLDPYVGIFGGVNFPGSLTHVAGIQDNGGLLLSDLALKVSPVYGVKLGLFLQPATIWRGWREWIGGEIDLSYSNPHVKQQSVTASGTLGGTPFTPFALDVAGAHVRVLTAAMHLLVRYPGQNFQPYIGGGPALFWARVSGIDVISGIPGTASDSSLGFQAVAGLRAFLPYDAAGDSLLRSFGFLEGRYQRASFEFGSNVFIKGDYAPLQAVGGLGIHF